MEFEAGESIIPPEMNAAYDHDEHALPSVLHRQRAKEHGEWRMGRVQCQFRL